MDSWNVHLAKAVGEGPVLGDPPSAGGWEPHFLGAQHAVFSLSEPSLRAHSPASVFLRSLTPGPSPAAGM